MKQIILNIKWMHCASCSILNENSLNALKWVLKARVNIATNKAIIDFDENEISIDKIIQTINNNWFESSIFDVNDNKNMKDENLEFEKKMFLRFIYSAVFSIPIFFMMFFMIDSSYLFLNIDLIIWIMIFLSWIVVYIFWFHFHIGFIKKIFKLSFNMDSLISIWSNSAFLYSIWAVFVWWHLYFEASVAIITFMNLWKYLEAKSKWKASIALQKLFELWVKNANVIDDNIIQSISIDKVKIWDIILIKSWEKIPLDWEIIEWESLIDESMLTWESNLVQKLKWNIVYWASINQNWLIKVKVLKLQSQTMLSQIINMVENAQLLKPSIQKLADYISWIFVPIVILISILTFFVWFYFTNDFSQSILYSISVLVIACPCSLWLATPIAIMVSSWVGANKWILIKDWESFEKFQNIDYVVFDKTWTLTEWNAKILDIIDINFSISQVQKICYSLARNSNHPFSLAIKKYWEENKINFINLIKVKEIPWKWVEWYCPEHNARLSIWNQKFMEENKIIFSKDLLYKIDQILKKWNTIIFVSHWENIIWLILIQDKIKPNSKKTIELLKIMWIETYMITWDNENIAQLVWNQLNIENIKAQVLPKDKLELIKQLQLLWKKVVFVWDWINDSPALAQADIWISMWNWSDIALESWNVILVNEDPLNVVSTIKLSRFTYSIIKQNLFFSFIYNLFWIILAIFGILNPIFASFAMAMSSVCVVINSLRIKKINL